MDAVGPSPEGDRGAKAASQSRAGHRTQEAYHHGREGAVTQDKTRRRLTVEAIVGGVPERWTSKAVRYWPDPSGYLERAAKRLIERDFPALRFAIMGFVW
jgi:hypothetical protein